MKIALIAWDLADKLDLAGVAGSVRGALAKPFFLQVGAAGLFPEVSGESAWWESRQTQIGLMAALTFVFAWYLLTGRGPGRILAMSGLLAVPGLALSMLRMNGTANFGPLLAGRPLDWIVLQVLSFTVLISGLVLAAQWKSTTVRQRVLLAGAAAFVPWAFYWGLLIP